MGWKNSALIIFSTSQCGFGIFIEDSNGWCKLLNVSSLLALLCWGAQHCCVEHTVPWANRAVWSAALPFARAGELLSFPGTHEDMGAALGSVNSWKLSPALLQPGWTRGWEIQACSERGFLGFLQPLPPQKGSLPCWNTHLCVFRNAVKLLGTGIFLRHLPFLLMLK